MKKTVFLVIAALLVGLTVGGCRAPQPPASEIPSAPLPTSAPPPAAATEQPLADKAVLMVVAPVILANADLLEGKLATVWSDKRAALEAKGAQYRDEPVVAAGKIITADGPPASEKFGKAIVKALQ